MAVIYSDYSRDKIGWFFGLSGRQLAIIAAASLPVFWSIQQGQWRSCLLYTSPSPRDKRQSRMPSSA